MPAQLTPAIEEIYQLTKTDEFLKNDGEPTMVTVKQATQGEHDKRMSLWAEFTRSFDAVDGMRVTQRVSPADVRKLEVRLTLMECNLQDSDGKQLFKRNMKEAEFSASWAKLPLLVADEIHEKVLALNLLWAGEPGEDV